jgi:hypothetical protein
LLVLEQVPEDAGQLMGHGGDGPDASSSGGRLTDVSIQSWQARVWKGSASAPATAGLRAVISALIDTARAAAYKPARKGNN